MKRFENAILWVVVVVIVIVAAVAGPYNSLVKLRNGVREQQAQVENVLQARLEKIPDLVAAVANYDKHAETVYSNVASARSGLQDAIDSGDMEKMAVANETVTQALYDLKAVVEAYPELSSSQLYIGLNDEISGSVNRISQERRMYNLAVTEYNNKLESFPTMLYARILGFEPAKYFEATTEAHTTNVVDFGD